MKFYTNKDLQASGNLEGTATIKINEDIIGKYSGEVIKKGSEVVVSGVQYRSLMSVLEDGNCTLDLVVNYATDSVDQFKLLYLMEETNFEVQSFNC
jgi:hypothetical protein